MSGCRGKAAGPVVTPDQTRLDQTRLDAVTSAVKASGAHPATYYDGLSDAALLSHPVQGLAIGLKMNAGSHASGAPITFHILVEDAGATEPIAGGLCSGLSLTWQKLDDNTSGTANIDIPHCLAAIPSPDEVPLSKGKVKTVDVTQAEASHTVFTPGTYLINLDWQPYAAGRGTIMGRQTYARLKSNVILFQVTA